MKKLIKRLISFALATISLSASILPMMACGETTSVPITTSFKMGINAPDGNFNPFFAASESDCKIVKQTQITMLTTDAKGQLVCGENQPTAVLSYTETMKNGEEATTNEAEATSTEYEFVIKRDVKFSDGTPLTIKDVLFNLYVYLDPMYVGPSTIYSTKIQGLNAYRLQDPLASDDQDVKEGEAKFYAKADERITNVINHLSDKAAYPITDEIAADIALIKKLFFEEVEQGEAANADVLNSQLVDVLTSLESVNTLREELAADFRSAYYDDFKEQHDGLLVKTISGITTSTKIVDDEEHDVLKITVNGVDATTIWNFAFPVAPMHYYAGETYANEANGVNYFGVEYGSKEFFKNVLQDPKKNALPVGAGPYQASNASGEITGVEGDDFYSGDWVYLTRNNHFKTVGSGLNNANIKNLWYKVVPTDQMLSALINNEIQAGAPNATRENLSEVDKYDYLETVTYTSNGYGYVGINPKAVPDIEVRQAIMKAMDTAAIVRDYYTADLAQMIHRPMSIQSWAYPKVEDKNVGRHKKVAFSRDVGEICSLVEAAGYRRADTNSVYVKGGKPLKLVFTIPGESKDHPAYVMFEETAKWLNENCGFDVTVATDAQAHSKLETGDLQVWAAERSFDIDPDLYQLYHRDSAAASIHDLGYGAIFADTTGQFTYEKNIVNQLSERIEGSRSTIYSQTRVWYYTEALNLIMGLCVELPAYQRKDMIVYNKKEINGSTINTRNASPTLGVFDRIWEVNYK